MGKSSKPQVTSGLTGGQQDIMSVLARQLLGVQPGQSLVAPKDINSLQSYGNIGKTATPYTGPLTATMLPGYGTALKTAQRMDPYAGMAQNAQTLSPYMSGQQAMSFSPLQGQGTLNYSPMQASGALAPQSSTYNFTPSQVHSTLSSAFTNDYFNKGIKAPLLRTFDEDIAPRIAEAAAGSGSSFSSRTQFQNRKALEGLNTQMGAQLSDAVRQDELTRAGQEFQGASQYQQQAQQSAQYGAGLNQQYAQMNAQNALNLGNSNAQNAAQAYQMSGQNKLAYDSLNTQTRYNLATDAMNRRLQGAQFNQQSQNQPLARAQGMEQVMQPIQNVRDQNTNNLYQQFLRTAPENSPYTQQAMAIAGLNPNSIAYQQQSLLGQVGQGVSQLGSIGQGVNNIFGAGGMLGGLFGSGVSIPTATTTVAPGVEAGVSNLMGLLLG